MVIPSATSKYLFLKLTKFQSSTKAHCPIRRISYKASLNNPVFPFPIALSSQKRQNCKEFKTVDDSSSFFLHDGPPYANGDLHFGHALNKILKDITVRFQVLRGERCSFIPGWDCHGLPIELAAMKNINCAPAHLVRAACLARASECMTNQLEQFASLNICTDWTKIYSTLDFSYQSTVIRCFRDLCEKNLIVRELKPVYWSSLTNCAISESELEYNPQHESTSLYFLISLQSGLPSFLPDSYADLPAFILVWTTTPWTIPGNVSIAFSPLDTYVVFLNEKLGRLVIVSKSFSKSLVTLVASTTANSVLRPLCEIPGFHLENLAYRHPLRPMPGGNYLLPGNFVADKGTGFVHIAPAHGKDDFAFAKQHGLTILSLVDEKACFTEAAGPHLSGLPVHTAGTAAVIDLLGDDVLVKSTFYHNYPYESRTRSPVITRVSEQWFVNTDALSEMAKEEYEKVAVFPPERKASMLPFIDKRPFWCISRQRTWGVPIPVVFHAHLRSPIIDMEFISYIGDRVARDGSEFWWVEPISSVVPAFFLQKWDLTYDEITLGSDIFDVWFESGLSWKAVLPKDYVADVYLEGLDQFRGWFSSSLLLSVALTGRAPFKNLVVHGFITDSEGRKMSKSRGNIVSPKAFLQRYDSCRDVVRRWAATCGLNAASSVGTKEFNLHAASYKKLRNMLRFMLGNLSDFPTELIYPLGVLDRFMDTCNVASDSAFAFSLLDRWALGLTGGFASMAINSFYPEYRFESVIAEADRLVSKLSNTYFNAVKDVLYCDLMNSPRRRAIQTTFWLIIEVLKVTLAPIFPDLTEEVERAQFVTLCEGTGVDLFGRLSTNSAYSGRSAVTSSGLEVVRCASEWRVNAEAAGIFASVSFAIALRQSISGLQWKCAASQIPLWPSPIVNPLARLRIALHVDPSESAASLLQALNVSSNASREATSLTDVLRCVSTSLYIHPHESLSHTEGCGAHICRRLLVAGSAVQCDITVADSDEQCPRCRLYKLVKESGKELCPRCSLVLE